MRCLCGATAAKMGMVWREDSHELAGGLFGHRRGNAAAVLCIFPILLGCSKNIVSIESTPFYVCLSVHLPVVLCVDSPLKGWRRCRSYRSVVTAVVQDKSCLMLLTRHSTCVRGLEQLSRSKSCCLCRTTEVPERPQLKQNGRSKEM